MEPIRSHQLKADLALLAVAGIWGATFVAVKNAVTDMPPFTFIALRFAAACIFLMLISPHKLRGLNRKTLVVGSLIGLLLFCGYAFQTIGLQYTTAANAGFITGLSVVLVPLFTGIANRRLPGLFTLLGIGCAAIGLAFLSLGAALSFNRGDLLVLFCAVCFAVQILAVGKYAPELDAFLLAVIQIGTVAVISGLIACLLPTQPAIFSRDVWLGLLLTAIPATSLAFLLQSTMQKFTTPTRTAIIFTCEPVFSAVFAYLLAGELLGMRGLVGATLVLAGMLLSELKPAITH